MKRTVKTGAMKAAQTARINVADTPPASPQADETQQDDQERATAKITAKTRVGTQARMKEATTATTTGKPLPPLPVVISGAKKEPAQRAVGWKSFFGGRRSRAARVTLWTVAVVAAFAFLIGATPLGQASPLGGTFQAYAQSAPGSRHATATPKPKVPAPGVNPGQQAIIDKITAVFGALRPRRDQHRALRIGLRSQRAQRDRHRRQPRLWRLPDPLSEHVEWHLVQELLPL